MHANWRRFRNLGLLVRGESAATAVEYALIAALIAGFCAAAVSFLGIRAEDLYSRLSSRW